MGLSAGTRIWLVVGVTDLHSGFNDLTAKEQAPLPVIAPGTDKAKKTVAYELYI